MQQQGVSQPMNTNRAATSASESGLPASVVDLVPPTGDAGVGAICPNATTPDDIARERDSLVLELASRPEITPQDAEDQVQEAVLKGVEQPGIVNKPAWLRKVALNGSRTANRKKGIADRHKERVADCLARNRRRSIVDPALEAQWRELAESLQEGLAALPEILRAVWLRHWDGESTQVLADYYGVTARAIRYWLAKARLLLRPYLTRFL
jgi:DNA-directed RNA polymerase specialized sigma24 family protein